MPAPSSEPWHKTYRSYLVAFGSLVAVVAGYYLWSSYGTSLYSFSSLPTGKNGEVLQREKWSDRYNAEKTALLEVKTQEMDAAKGWGSNADDLTEQWKTKVAAAKAEYDGLWFNFRDWRGTVKTPPKLAGMSHLKEAQIMADDFKFSEGMARANYKSKFMSSPLTKAQDAAIKEAYNADKKAHDDFYGDNSETWINGKNLDRAAGAGVGLLAGAGVGLLGAGEEKKKPSSSNKKRPSRRNPPRTDNTKKGKGKTSGQKTEPKANGKGNESGGKGLIIFLIILACLAAVAAGIYIFCFMGKDEDFDDEELVAEDV